MALEASFGEYLSFLGEMDFLDGPVFFLDIPQKTCTIRKVKP